MRALVISWGLGILMAAAAHAGTAGHARTEALLRAVGVDSYLAGFADEIGGADNPMAESFSDISEAWTAAARENFQTEAMFADVTEAMAGGLDAGQMAALEAFYSSPLGLEITAMEVAAQRAEMALQVKTEGADILRGLIAREDPRLEQLTQLIEALAAVETGLAMAESLNHAVLSGMSASGQMPYKLSSGQIDAMVAAQRGLMRGAIQEQLFVSMAYSYQTLSDDDLDAYIAFLQTDAGRAFYGRLLASTEAVIGARAHRFGARLMELQATEQL